MYLQAGQGLSEMNVVTFTHVKVIFHLFSISKTFFLLSIYDLCIILKKKKNTLNANKVICSKFRV